MFESVHDLVEEFVPVKIDVVDVLWDLGCSVEERDERGLLR